MTWQEFQRNDRLEQEQLDICHALIADATRDTAIWLEASPPAEERVHILAIQDGLAALEKIIARRMERRRASEDEWVWPETVREVLSLLDKAREVRGHMVGKGLGRLAERLPRELPGSKLRLVSQAPAPSTTLSGTGGWIPRQPKPTEVPANPPTYFPSDLWPQTNVILLESRKKFPSRTQTLELCKHVISEMTPLFCEAVKAGKMKAGAVQRERSGGMEDLLHFLLVHNDDGVHDGLSSLSDKAYRLGQNVRRSDEWLALAKAVSSIGAATLRTGIKQTEHPDAQSNDKTTLSSYLEKVIKCLAVEPADLWSEYGEAAPYVRQLAEIEWNKKIQWNTSGDAVESYRKRDQLIQIICRDYPEAARKLDLQAPQSIKPAADGNSSAESIEVKPTNAAAGTEVTPADHRAMVDEYIAKVHYRKRKEKTGMA
jgi:hypothetical protein